MNSFSQNLKLLRLEKNLGQVELAQKLGVSKGIISLWENGQREPTMQYIIKIALFFDVSADYLLGIERF